MQYNHKNIIYTILTLFLVNSIHLNGQTDDTKVPFQSGESISYHAFYNWHFIWLNAGEASFTVNTTQYNKKPAYLFESIGGTYNGYDKLFKVRDTFRVVSNIKTLDPILFDRYTNEGDYTSHHRYLFDKESRLIYSKIKKKKKPLKQDTIEWQKNSFDILSMVYKARSIDFNQYKPNDKIPMNMLVDGKIYNLYIRYFGKEVVKNRDDREFNCHKFSPLLVEGTIFSAGEDMFVWVTDDKNRIPILVEAKLLVGSAKAIFTEAKGLKYPLSSEIIKN